MKNFINYLYLLGAFSLEGQEVHMAAAAPTTNVCDLGGIYSSGFQYSLPQQVLEGFFSGVAFDNKVPYTHEEQAWLRADIIDVYRMIMESNPTRAPFAVIEAGAPGAGKTTLSTQDIERARVYGINSARIDPDFVCLRQFESTFRADVYLDPSPEGRKRAYDKWRPGSNAGAHAILANLIREKMAFHFGTTSTGPATHFFFNFLRQQGYNIRLLHVTAPDQVRWDSIQERDKTFIQTTEKDTVEKGLLLPQRIQDTFLKYADRIEFYYRGAVREDAKLAAVWIRNSAAEEKLGSLEVVDRALYEQVKRIHDAGVEILGKPELSWVNTVEASSIISMKQ